MRWGWLTGAAVAAIFLFVRRRAHGRVELALGGVATVAAALVGFGVIPLPNIEHLVEELGSALGRWTYLFVGVMAFLETGAFVGLVAPGETTIIVGGLVAGQGEISLLLLIAIVWVCAVAGDVTSYFLGRRLGRSFLERHGARVKITEERLQQVERFFARHGGATILIGRFIGLVRAIAPFMAGASHMELRRFLPYDVLGAGLWSTAFCTLGFVFWHSFDTLTDWVSRGLFAFGTVVALGVVAVFVVRLYRDRAFRRRTRAVVLEHLQRPYLRPFAPVVRAGYRFARRHAEPIRRAAGFFAGRVTPGRLGLELTSLLAIALVSLLGFVLLAEWQASAPVPSLDRDAFDLADELYGGLGRDVAVAIAALGSFSAAAVGVALVAGWAAARGRRSEAIALVAGFLLSWAAVRIGKGALDRPRPAAPHVGTAEAAFPSGHAANAVAWVACAVVLVRARSGLAIRSAAVAVSVVLVVLVAITQVYLRAHHATDVLAGVAAAALFFSLAGMVALIVDHLRHNGSRAA